MITSQFDTAPKPKAVYIKPRKALLEHERRRFDWLLGQGIVPTTLEEVGAAPVNIDLKIRKSLWEMKNVTNSGSSVSNQLGRIRDKWRKLEKLGEAKGVITLYGCDATLDEVTEAVAERHGYAKMIVIGDEGMWRIKK